MFAKQTLAHEGVVLRIILKVLHTMRLKER